MRNIINSHNKKILEAENKTNITCNCRNKMNCPINGECLLKGVYKAKVRDKEHISSTGVFLKQGDNNTSTAFSRNYKQQPWLNLPH